jgi:L-alanine-DL-glutamate epimerase-like enolase superfamily enzyme
MTRIVRLLAGLLHYTPDVVLHTASSGRIAALDELYLVVEQGGALAGFGEIRVNVGYLTGLTPAQARASAIALVRALDWTQPRAAIAAQFEQAKDRPAIARALVDSALVDWAARERDVPVAELFGAEFNPDYVTNQSLFLGDDDELVARAARYVARGFRKLKLRVGALPWQQDCERLALLRRRFASEIELAIDANGAWTFEQAIAALRAMADFDLAYVEQPIAAGDWEALTRLADATPIPLMIDEGLASLADVDRTIAAGGRIWAHLKLIKLGGITPTIVAARRLKAAGVPFMIGQMNEGAGATAAAYHCAVTTQPAHAELYGADGLLDDPVRGIGYADGRVHVRRAPGHGVTIDTKSLETVLETVLEIEA